MSVPRTAAVAALLCALCPTVSASAQTLASFRWQLQPYCNVVTVTVVQQGGQYQVDGTDDQCGAPRKASVVGLAFPNPDGTIGFGLTTVTAPGGTPVHVDATIAIATLSGTWRDSAGNVGAFVFTPGPGAGGGPRPLPSGGLGAGSVTMVHIAPGAVGNAQLDANSVAGTNVVDGSITTADLAAPSTAGFASGNQNISLTSQVVVVRSVTLDVPAAGRVIVNASGYFVFSAVTTTMEQANCSITTGTLADFFHLISATDGQSPALDMTTPFAATRGFNVTAGSFTVNLVCYEAAGTVSLIDSSMTAIFTGS